MKKKILFTLGCTLCLIGCNSHSDNEIVSGTEQFHPLQFSIQMEKEVMPFPTTRSIPENTVPEPSIPNPDASGAELDELCNRIEYLVYKVEDEISTLFKHKQFTPEDMDFGIVYDSLPKGDYRFYFIGHSSKTVTLKDSTVLFDKVSDTFYKTLSLRIEAAREIREDITMERIVSRIEFMATDTVPKEIKRFDMAVNGIANQLDITKGTGISSAATSRFSHTFIPDEIGFVNFTHSFYTFSSPTDNKLSVQLDAIGENETVLRERNITGITPEKNKIIRYKGLLYHPSESDDTFTVSILNNGAWDETKEEELPDNS